MFHVDVEENALIPFEGGRESERRVMGNKLQEGRLESVIQQRRSRPDDGRDWHGILAR